MKVLGVVDSNILIAAGNLKDPNHRRCAELLLDESLRLVVPALCVTEVCYFLNRDIGPLVEARFLESLTEFEVIAPDGDDWLRIGALVRQYADFPLGGTDASVVALAEQLGTDTILTLDRRHFAAIHPVHCESLRLLPE